MLDDFSSRADFPQVDERRTHGDVGRRLRRQAEQQRLDQLGVLGTRSVHLPVSGDEGPAHRSTSISRTARPTRARSRAERRPERRARKLSGAPLRKQRRRIGPAAGSQAASAAEATEAASSLAISRTSFSSLPSTMTRITGSVPDGRSTMRPLLAEPALRRAPRLPGSAADVVGSMLAARPARSRAPADTSTSARPAPRGCVRSRFMIASTCKRADQRIAGRRVIQAQQVAGGLAAERAAGLLQHLQHVAIADLGATELDALLRQRMLQAEVAHDGADDRPAQRASARWRARAMM